MREKRTLSSRIVFPKFSWFKWYVLVQRLCEAFPPTPFKFVKHYFFSDSESNNTAPGCLLHQAQAKSFTFIHFSKRPVGLVFLSLLYRWENECSERANSLLKVKQLLVTEPRSEPSAHVLVWMVSPQNSFTSQKQGHHKYNQLRWDHSRVQ